MSRRQPSQADVDAALAAASADAPRLEPALRLRAELLRAVLASASTASLVPFPLPRERLLGKLIEGSPLLHGEPAQVDVPRARSLLTQLARMIDPQVAQALEDADLDLSRLLEEAFEQHPDHVAALLGRAHLPAWSWTEPAREDGRARSRVSQGCLSAPSGTTDVAGRRDQHEAPLQRTLAAPAVVDASDYSRSYEQHPIAHLAALAVLPSRWAYARQLTELATRFNAVSHWRQPYCFICGAWPSFLLDNASTPWCGACNVEWSYPNAKCPSCSGDSVSDGVGAQPPRERAGELGSPAPESSSPHLERRGEVITCPRCLSYRVAIDTETPLAYLGLDLGVHQAAQLAGFHPPRGAGFRVELAAPESAWVDDLEGWDE